MDEDAIRWAGGICIRNGKVLLIYRINKERDFNQEYFVFPGDSVLGDESIEVSVIAQFDAIGITIKLGEIFYAKEEVTDESEYYYLCEYVRGEPVKNKDQEENESQFYTPMWISLEEIDDLIVYPESVKHLLIETFVDTV